jgi:uncharacterized membrane protein
MEINNQLIKDNSELRMAARKQLRGKWGSVVLLCFVFYIINGLLGIPYVGILISILISGALMLGLVSCFIKIVRDESFKIENLFDGFKNFGSALLLQLLIGVFVFLWSLLLLIPGIIAAYRYSMAFYILNDKPEIGAMDALNKSKEMMRGFKWKLFCLHLSFIGWALLCILSLGIGFLWLVPYIKAAEANFYEDLKEAMPEDFLA